MFDPSPSLQQLADLLRPALGMPAKEASLTNDEFDLALSHRVAPLLSHALQLADIEPEEAIAERLLRETEINARRVLQQKSSENAFGKLLDGAGIEYRIVKGYRLGELLYGRETRRVSKDIDLLIGPAKIDQAVRIAAKAGYTRANGKSVNEGIARTQLRFHREIEIRDPNTGAFLELHSRLLDFPDAEWTDETFFRVQLDLSSPEYVLYLVLHGVGSQWRRLKWLADLAMIAQHTRPNVRREVIGLARHLQCLPAIAASFHACQSLWREDVLADWIEEIGLAASDSRVLRHLTAFSHFLDQDDDRSLHDLISTRLRKLGDEPVFGDRQPSLMAATTNRLAIWFLERF